MRPSLVIVVGLIIFLASAAKGIAAEPSSSLAAVVLEFEAAGGAATFFESEFPDQLGGESGAFFLIKSLPASVQPKSNFFLLRTEATLEALRVMLKGGAPLLLCEIPLNSQVGATALSGFKLSNDVFNLTRGSPKTVIAIQPETSIFILEHEYQHWLDFEDAAFMKSIAQAVGEVYISHNVNADKLRSLSKVIIELRGHSIQAKAARIAKENKWPYIDRSGTVIDAKRASEEGFYAFEEGLAAQTFNETYGPDFAKIFDGLSFRQANAITETLRKFDWSDDNSNTLTFLKSMPWLKEFAQTKQ